MTIHVNGKEESLSDEKLTINELLAKKQVPDPDMVSVQHNGEILDREDFATRHVSEGDVLEFLYFMGGGNGGYRIS